METELEKLLSTKINPTTPKGVEIEMKEIEKTLSRPSSFLDFALLINGSSLSIIFEDKVLCNQIRTLFDRASSVIVYRSSPNDKAEVIKFVKGNTN